MVALNLTGSLVGVFYDDGIYLALGRSLAEGHGYRLLYLPGAPGAVHYPFLYPLLLAALSKLAPAFPADVAAAQGGERSVCSAWARRCWSSTSTGAWRSPPGGSRCWSRPPRPRCPW